MCDKKGLGCEIEKELQGCNELEPQSENFNRHTKTSTHRNTHRYDAKVEV
jgi:hypothetical protein